MVPAIAVPRDEPRFDTLRDRPEISPCMSSPKLDCTRLTDGVSIAPSPNPTSSRPGANAHGVEVEHTSATSTPAHTHVMPNRAMNNIGRYKHFVDHPAYSGTYRRRTG